MQWNPHKVTFTGIDNMESRIESRNASLIETNFREDNDHIPFSDHYFEPMKIFYIKSFNRRIMKLLVIDARTMDGPLT